MSKPFIISGEASETESEDESMPSIHLDLTKSIQGAVILGENSESDNDNEGSIASAISAIHFNDCDSSSCIDHDSLFQQKLCESNTSLYNTLESLFQSTIGEAEKTLGSVEHQLLKSQITLQGAVTSLKTLSVNSLTLKNKFHSLLSSNFLPNINCSKLNAIVALLGESNTSLYNTLESLFQSTIGQAAKTLGSVEHQLLKSQITLQGAVTSLKTLSVNSLTLKNKFHSLLSSNFLPNINCSKLNAIVLFFVLTY
ncbi:uncharacterized protein LOC125505862 [Dendroctonus ponderosae]|uniref:uncharacterized protein LOC125505862 n=1 Tax=Dendroctonus ponderosae TaxID=77166 RepID=UPI00203501AF|nr:uncharacterized protein LOC125505862 [Dendroctonus ponderosae]